MVWFHLHSAAGQNFGLFDTNDQIKVLKLNNMKENQHNSGHTTTHCMTKKLIQSSLAVGGKVGQATLSPGQLHRKETPPLQHGAGPVEPSSGGDVTDDMLSYPAFPAKSDPVAQSSSSILAIHPSHTHKHTKHMYTHTRKTLKATSRGPVDEAQQQCGFVC